MSLFMALTIFGLSAGPGKMCLDMNANEMSTTDHSCCKKDQVSESSPTKTDENHQNSCEDNGCNPFINCCGSMGFVGEKRQEFSFDQKKQFHELNFGYNSMHGTILLHEILDPPKV